MVEAFSCAFLLAFALVGIVATGFYLILRIYNNYNNCVYIINLDNEMKTDEIVDAICTIQVRAMLGLNHKIRVCLIDYGLDKDKRQLAIGLCRGYDNFEILDAEDFYERIKR